MFRYQSNKQVHAEPMKKSEWYKYRVEVLLPTGVKYSNHTSDKVPEDGVHVVYDKGLETEYHSWSPASIFYRDYTQLP